MPLAPGVYVRSVTAPSTASPKPDPRTWFIAGPAERGPVDRAAVIYSAAEYQALYGARVGNILMSDAVETFFACGGLQAVVARVAGPAAATAQKILNDSGSAAALTVNAASPGVWGNGLTVQVAAGSAGGTFVLVIALSGIEVERSGDLVDTAAAAAWSQASQYVRVTATGTNDPDVAAAAALTGGTDDNASITATQYTAALALFPRVMGPGQVSAPGVTTQAIQTALCDHAAATNRVALLDLVDSSTPATLVAAASAISSGATGWVAQTFGQWVVVRGLTTGTTRTVPYSAVQAGMIAQTDTRYPWGQQAPAGDFGILPSFVVGVTQTWTDTQRATLNDAGIVAAVQDGQLKTYGLVGLGTGLWRQHQKTRVRMACEAAARNVASHFVFRTIDGQGVTQREYADALRGALLPAWQAGALYGQTADDALTVDAGDGINTPATKAAGDLNANVDVTLSDAGERVNILITSHQAA